MPINARNFLDALAIAADHPGKGLRFLSRVGHLPE
jgi:hypothetical protein